MSGADVVLLARDGIATRIIDEALSKAGLKPIVILERGVSAAHLLRHRIRRYGVRRVAGQVAFRVLVVPWLLVESRMRRRAILAENSLDARAIDEARLRRIASANGSDTRCLLAELAPRVVIVNGTRILCKETLASTRGPFVNIHAGITPMYRGVHGGYWALANNDPQRCGVTVHLVNEGIDTGPLLAQQIIQPTARDNLTTYPLLQLMAALSDLQRVVATVLAGEMPPRLRPASGLSRYWSHPTCAEYASSRVRRGVR